MLEEKITIQIVNRLGLHARAAAKFVQTAGRYDCDVWVTRGMQVANGKSIMDMMMLGANQGVWVEVHTVGPEATSAITALIALIQSFFGETG